MTGGRRAHLAPPGADEDFPMLARLAVRVIAGMLVAGLAVPGAVLAQAPPGPPAVGVVQVMKTSITESSEYVGRIQAIDRVDLTARVTAFLEERLFVEGTEVAKGDLLYRLERWPFEADLQQKTGVVAQMNALLQNANITLDRAKSLLNTPAGLRSGFDDAQAQSRSYAAQLVQAAANQRASQINLDYTEIRAPISGKIGRTNVTQGNVVTPSSGVLATIVSQDPMYVLFPVSVRAVLDLQDRYRDRGGLEAVVVKLRLPTGRLYGPEGKIDFVDPIVAQSTDTLTMRARMPNPPVTPPEPGKPVNRALTDGEFVTAIIEGVEPVQALAIPRSCVLSDQQGSYVYVVGDKNIAEQRRITLGQSSPETAVVLNGLKEGETVVVDGIQRVRPGQPVNPGPASPGPGVTPAAAKG
jgi:membrane fusion protein (multidrug efflux system)